MDDDRNDVENFENCHDDADDALFDVDDDDDDDDGHVRFSESLSPNNARCPTLAFLATLFLFSVSAFYGKEL